MSEGLVGEKTIYRVVPVAHESELWQHCRDIRIEVFHHEQGYSLAEEIDDLDPQCIHLLLLAHTSSSPKEEPAGVLRYFPPPKSKIGRVAVRKPFRGKGAGGALMKGLEALMSGAMDVDEKEPPMELMKERPKEMALHAQVPVVPFYLGLGYMVEGDPFIEDGTPHIKMHKTIVPL